MRVVAERYVVNAEGERTGGQGKILRAFDTKRDGAIVALAHPLTIVAAILAAPLTSLNPMIAAGWVSGLVEAVLRKPKVKDFEDLAEDIQSIKGFWRNHVTRILLVVVLTNIGSALGTMVAAPLIVKLFVAGG